MTHIFVDGDACPVKDEVYSVAARYDLTVWLVANQRMRVPPQGVEMIVVGNELDAADDWIAEEVHAHDVVVTADIPLAARCLEKGALVLGNNGEPFTEDMIHTALAVRDLKSELRDAGTISGGPPALSAKDRSRFSSRLDAMVNRALREGAAART